MMALAMVRVTQAPISKRAVLRSKVVAVLAQQVQALARTR
jgi:hypothetical protein